MHAVVVGGGDVRWRNRPDPKAGDTGLLVEVRAAGVNGADLLQREGLYPPPPGWPVDIPGLEMAGRVVRAGARATRFKAGDRVMALVGGGAQATLAVVDEAHALAVPDSMAWPEAGAFPEIFATAFDALFTQGRLGLGERLLVTGAAGGVGCAAVQLGALAGAHVVASVRNRELHDGIAALGAAEVIEPAQVAEHGPYDVVLELVGAASLPDALESIAMAGRIVVIGVGSGALVQVNLQQLMGRRARLMAATLRARPHEEKAAVMAALATRVVPQAAAGGLHVPVFEAFPLREAERAYQRYAAPGKLGKIVLVA